MDADGGIIAGGIAGNISGILAHLTVYTIGSPVTTYQRIVLAHINIDPIALR
jgi:hypothetical protein